MEIPDPPTTGPAEWKAWAKAVKAAFAKVQVLRSGVGTDVNELGGETATVNDSSMRTQGDPAI